MSDPKISLCMIVKPDDGEANLLDRCLASAAEHVDEICVTVTGMNEAVEVVARRYNAKLSQFDWNDSFADARTYNFAQASGDFILWLDADDVLSGGANLRRVAKGMEAGKVKAAVAWYKYDFNEWGDCIVKHRKTRMIRNDGSFKWFADMGELHEDLQPTYSTARIAYIDDEEHDLYFEVHHLTSEDRVQKNAKRNLRIAQKQVEKYKSDPRALWNLGNSQVMCTKAEDAIKTFREFIDKSGSEEEKYLAHHRIGGLLNSIGNTDDALNAEFEAVKLRPHYPDAWVGIGTIFYGRDEYRKAKEFLITGLAKKRPDSIIVFNPRDYDQNPLKLLANCYYNLGKPRDALRVIQQIHKMFPKDKDTEKLLHRIEKTVEDLDLVDEFCKKAEQMDDAELAVELESLPPNMRTHPKVCIVANSRFRKVTTTGKDIAYYCGYTNEQWGPDSTKTGIGGSEEAVINLTKRWAAEGYNVTVYCNCGNRVQIDDNGVTWQPYWTFNPQSKYDTLIVWRNPSLLDHKIDAKVTLLDVHDVLQDEEFTADRLANVTKVLVKTNYHRSLFPSVPDEKVAVIGNGIDLSHFEDSDVKREPHNMIYTSSPDRGLEHLLDGWSELRKRVPDATLDIYYGWGVFDAMYADDPEKQKWKKEMEKKMNQEGITVHGRVGHDEIAKAMMRADVFAYPCHFEEIFCISAVKAQAAKCYVVATDYAALPEVVKDGGGVLVSGDVKGDSMWGESYIPSLIGSLQASRRPDVDVSEYSWENISKAWITNFA